MNPWLWTNLWIRWWTRAAMLPLTVMAPPPARLAGGPETEEYLVKELLEDLELQGVQGIIDEGGRG